VIWLSWRQQRLEVRMVAYAAHHHLVATLSTLGIPNCVAGRGAPSACTTSFELAKQDLASQQTVFGWMAYLPMLIGALLAASVVLELEQGGHRLSWTQSVTRSQWARARLGLPLVAGVAATLAIAALGSWWLEPASEVQSRLAPGSYDLQGVVPVAYMALAFAVTVLAGILWRRTLLALGLGVGLSFLSRFAVQTWLRPSLISPVARIWKSGAAPYTRLDWLVQGGSGATSFTYVDPAGHHFSLQQAQALCGQAAGTASKPGWGSCLQLHHLGELVRFQPPSRFWLIQSMETLLVAFIAGALLVLARWLLQERAF
jgi:hypothetical protein